MIFFPLTRAPIDAVILTVVAEEATGSRDTAPMEAAAEEEEATGSRDTVVTVEASIPWAVWVRI